MVKQFLLMILMVSCSFAKAQTNAKNYQKDTGKGLQENFSYLTLKAYQEISKNRVEDFYQYLQLLGDSSTSDSLKKEIITSIYLLFKDKNTLVTDFTSGGHQKIELTLLLNKVRSRPLKFALMDFTINDSFENDNWNLNYKIKVSDGIKSVVYNSQLVVYLIQQPKSFGMQTKEVWNMLLGEIK